MKGAKQPFGDIFRRAEKSANLPGKKVCAGFVKRKVFIKLAFLFAFLAPDAGAAPLYSPTWGFTLDLPEGYEYSGGDNKESFLFESPDGGCFDIVVYQTGAGGVPYADLEGLARDVGRRLNNSGDTDFFEYRRKKAALLELSFPFPDAGGRTSRMSGWALCVEFMPPEAARPVLLLAMAYGPAEKAYLQTEYLSALDSLAPEAGDKRAPGPVSEYSYPGTKRVEIPLSGTDTSALFYEEDAEAAQAVIDRELSILRRAVDSPAWKEAWIRFYRAIYRDSYERLADAAFKIERSFNVPPLEDRALADAVLKWTQSFRYERDFFGSDFVNLVSAATEGRGDCDSRAMLWALIMARANIPSAMMVSRQYGHAMGLAELEGSGARFPLEGKNLLVAETTTDVSTGLIGENVSEIGHWIGITFE